MNNKTGNRKNSLLIIILGILILLVFCIGFIYITGNSAINLFNNRSTILPDTSTIIEIITNSDPDESETSSIDLENEFDIDFEILYNPFWESYDHLNNYFIDQPLNKTVLAEGAIEGLYIYLDEYNINIDEIIIPENAPSPKELSKQAKTPSEASDEFIILWEVWQKLLYVEFEDELAHDLLMQYSLSYMALALEDPYTSYLDPIQYHINQEYLHPTGYEGIGAWVDISRDYITVISPMLGSPAESAGLRPNDKIIAIDGEDMTGVDGNIGLQKVLGPAGTTVILRILRDGVAPFDVEIIRGNIETPSIRGEILEDEIAYLRIFSFSFNSPSEVNEMLSKLLEENPTGLILDLRFNPGGYINQVIQITSEFLTDGIVLQELYGDGSKDTYEVLPGAIAPDIPMVVIVNEGSASASEILAGALQDYDRAIIVGQTTFGKGSVLVNIPLSDEKGSISVTIAKWLSPDGRYIQDSGIDPDIFVEITDADYESNLDPQLDKAIEILLTP